jgi:uncharacterized protein YdeI (BOF family)
MLNRFHSKPSVIALAIAGAVGAGALQAEAQTPYSKPDGSYISISGTVASPEADEFVLDYGSGNILVEMDDWDRYGDAYGLLDGDKVTVFGRIDDDFFEIAKIEAGSVYVENLNTYFYANRADEESYPDYWVATTPIQISAMTVMGDVKSVDADGEKFIIDTGIRDITVETEKLAYNPLDDSGYQQIDVGDYVSVSGMMNFELFDGQVFEADIVTTLIDEEAS